jgi:hypothetical protein
MDKVMRFRTRVVLYLLLAWSPLAAVAEEWVIAPKVSLLHKDTEFTDQAGNVDVAMPVSTAELGITVARNKFYGSFSYDRSINSGYEFDDGRELHMSRQDVTLTGGYTISSSFSVFAGLKNGVSDITLLEVTTSTFSDLLIQDSGVFLGLSYQHSLGENIALSTSLAYANMAGNVKRGGTSATAFDIDGDTAGLSLNAGLSMAMESNQVLAFGFKAHRYEFTSSQIDFDQNFNMLYLSLSFYR